MSRIVSCMILLTLSFSVYAVETRSIFYSLPSQNQNHFLTAKKLFPNPNGGVWVQDTYNHIHFYDGQHLLPKSSSVIDTTTDQVIYLDGTFWYFENNDLYRMDPLGQKTLLFTLPTTDKFESIGESNGFIWLYSAGLFHTFNPKSGQITSYPIEQIIQGSITENTVIQDAVYFNSRWLIATKSSLYYLGQNGIKRATPTVFSNIAQIVFDPKHKQLLVGTDEYLFGLDLNTNPLEKKVLVSGKIQAILVADDGYWVGTRKGLYVYSFENKNAIHISANYQDEYALSNDTILALTEDSSGGVWIATAKGVNYYSQISALLKRIRFGDRNGLLPYSQIHQVQIMDNGIIWLATDIGLFKIIPSQGQTPNQVKKIRRGEISNIALNDGEVWFTEGDKLFKLTMSTSTIESVAQDTKWSGNTITHLAIGKYKNIWISTSKGLYRYFPKQLKSENFGKRWMVDQYEKSDITSLYSGSNGIVWVGTEHGIYEYKDQEVTFNANSIGLGNTISISDFNMKTLWTANNYGVLTFNIENGKSLKVPLKNTNSVPLCVAASQYGTWVVTSKGLSFYNDDARLMKHYSSPFGVITNEFLPNRCALSSNGEHLVLASKLGLVFASTKGLEAKSLPENKVLIGEVQVDRTVVSVAPSLKQPLYIEPNKPISFLFGILPDFDTPHLQYRLIGSKNELWTTYKGSQLTFDYLNSGQYTLEFKTLSQVGSNQGGTQLRFIVNNKWYQLPWMVFFLGGGILILIISVIAWRSRIMVRSNFRLRQLINLKTQQLNHQSQLLISTNIQLKKQTKTRQILVNNMAEKVKASIYELQQQIRLIGNGAHSLSRYSNEALDRVEQILALHSNNAKQNTLLDGQVVSLVIHTVIKGWLAEIEKASVTLKLDDLTEGCTVQVKHFNLDSILSMLIASALSRSEANQVIYLKVKLLDNKLQITLQDTGKDLTEEDIRDLEAYEYGLKNHALAYQSSEISLSAIAHMVMESGGRLNFKTNRICRTTEVSVSWPIGSCHYPRHSHGRHPDIGLQNSQLIKREQIKGDLNECEESLTLSDNYNATLALTLKDKWLSKVYALVEHHYPNPDFSTSSAAKLLFVSERSLQRKFKYLTGKSFMDYVIKVRLDNACERLMLGQKIADIAFEVGFNDPSYFSQRFKHHFGLSPSKFLENTSNKMN